VGETATEVTGAWTEVREAERKKETHL